MADAKTEAGERELEIALSLRDELLDYMIGLPEITPHSLRRTWPTRAAMIGRDPSGRLSYAPDQVGLLRGPRQEHVCTDIITSSTSSSSLEFSFDVPQLAWLLTEADAAPVRFSRQADSPPPRQSA